MRPPAKSMEADNFTRATPTERGGGGTGGIQRTIKAAAAASCRGSGERERGEGRDLNERAVAL